MNIIKNEFINQTNNNTISGFSYENGFSIFNLESLIDLFILNVDVASTSKLTYKRGLNNFVNWAKIHFSMNIFKITRETILLYKEFLLNAEIKPFTKSLYLVCIRQFFTWTEGSLIYPNVARGIKGIKKLTKSHNKDSLKKEQVLHFFKSIDQLTIVGKRDYCLIYMLIHTGMRLTEASNILISDIQINSNNNSIIWIKGKGRDGKDAFIVLVPEVVEVLLNYLNERKKIEEVKLNDVLFVSHGPKTKYRKLQKRMSTNSLSRIIKIRLQKAGIKTSRITAHSLRHTFGVLAIQSGASLFEVQLAMRHSSPTTTQVYLGDIEQMKRMEASPENRIMEFLNRK